MNALMDRKLRFSDVAYAIDATPKSLRNWLQRKQVSLTTSEGSGWREFNLADVAILALVRQMVDFGLTVEEASDFANVIIMGHRVTYDPNATHFAHAVRFVGERLLLWRSQGEWLMRIVDADEMKPGEYPDAYISIALSPVVARAVQRALLGSELDDWSAEEEASLTAALEKLIITIKDAASSSEEGDE
ncbi:MerR family transcriptional regulator [Chelativorans sp. SCAU2101]|uniref:MerR family transcriptional regulator n=1 Tax=Chelativorans petroleitrophicus TaxID=2975484 RepID=A0A9X2XCI6_9HYPH|nr:MerR family transcriptional regulator [Chelativorans petroleitrophicus]MCT8992042.1 MerR family transcriptional regulator [Chelativorans petroleitrophicus]